MAKIRIIEANSEIGAGTRGASMGMQALRVAAWKNGSDLFESEEEDLVGTQNEVLYDRDSTPTAHHIDGLARFEQQLAYAVSKWLKKRYVSIVVGGDHSIAIGSVSGTKGAFPKERLGVVWIDAHADLHSPYTTPSGNVHGMPLAVLLDVAGETRKRNDPTPETRELWGQLHDIGVVGAKLMPEDLVFIGLRDTEPEEDAIIEKHGIKVIRVDELRRIGAGSVVSETLSHLSECDRIHISFDVDSLDPTISRGTGTPVEYGLFLDEARILLDGLMKDERSCTLDVVEINPALDVENRMAEAVLPLLDSVYGVLKNR